MQDKLGAYRQADTLGKSQLDLILQVYDGAIQAFKGATQHYGAEEFQQGFDCLEKAKRFVTHLYTTLDFENGGEVAENLGRMYAFILNEANVAQSTKNLTQLDKLSDMLNNLREGWAALKGGLTETQTDNTPSAAPVDTGGFVTTG